MPAGRRAQVLASSRSRRRSTFPAGERGICPTTYTARTTPTPPEGCGWPADRVADRTAEALLSGLVQP
jgi:hypothetical protein